MTTFDGAEELLGPTHNASNSDNIFNKWLNVLSNIPLRCVDGLSVLTHCSWALSSSYAEVLQDFRTQLSQLSEDGKNKMRADLAQHNLMVLQSARDSHANTNGSSSPGPVINLIAYERLHGEYQQLLDKEFTYQGRGRISSDPANIDKYLRVFCPIRFRFDRFKDRLMYYEMDHVNDLCEMDYELREMRGTLIAKLMVMMSDFGFIGHKSTNSVLQHCEQVGEEDGFDSAQDKLKYIPVPSLERSQEILGNLMPMATDNAPCEYGRLLGKYLFASLAARILDPGHKVDGVLVLTGKHGFGAQGIGKQLFYKSLCLDPSWYQEIDLDSSFVELARSLHGSVVVEVSELRKLDSRDEEKIKKFITSTSDRYRALYSNVVEDHPRRCILVASTNHEQFLSDPTGNRRWFPYGCLDKLNIDYIQQNIEALWGAGICLFREVGVNALYEKILAILPNSTHHHTIEPSQAPAIADFLKHNPRPHYTTQEIAYGIGFEHQRDITRYTTVQIGLAMRYLGYRYTMHRHEGARFRIWAKLGSDQMMSRWIAWAKSSDPHDLVRLASGSSLSEICMTVFESSSPVYINFTQELLTYLGWGYQRDVYMCQSTDARHISTVRNCFLLIDKKGEQYEEASI